MGVALLALLALLAAGVAGAGNRGAVASSHQEQERPNVVVIQTDDQTLSQLYATWVTPNGLRARVMPNTLDLIGRPGATFTRYYTTYPLCCPSRASLLSGSYAHSNGVRSNDPPDGGWYAFQRNPILHHNIATWLQRSGYRTIHLGKFLNGYGGITESESELRVPPGWDEWQTYPNYHSDHLFYGYNVNRNGVLEGPFGEFNYNQTDGKDSPGCPDFPPFGGTCNHATDQLSARAVDQVNVSAPGRPFFMMVDYVAPHGDIRPPIGPEPAARNYGSAERTRIPRGPNFNEGNINDKPSFIREQANYLTPIEFRRMRIEWQKSLESLRDVDQGIKRIVNALRSAGELDNTYIFFLSDNGFFFGEHRLERAKFLPYEPSIHVPLLVRGPGIKRRTQTGELAANIDIAPTILELTGAKATRRLDGRSLVPYWEDPDLRSRRPILIESFVKATGLEDAPADSVRTPRGKRATGAHISIQAPPENYLGVRLGPYIYVEYETGDRELYDLAKDPHQLNNRIRDPRFDRVQAFMRRQIRRLEGCTGKDCKYVVKRIPHPGAPIFNQTIGPPR